MALLAHPRVCGRDASSATRCAADVRLIPACAGETLAVASRWSPVTRRRLIRVCAGETPNPRDLRTQDPAVAAHPCVRGRDEWGDGELGGRARFIRASAGETRRPPEECRGRVPRASWAAAASFVGPSDRPDRAVTAPSPILAKTLRARLTAAALRQSLTNFLPASRI